MSEYSANEKRIARYLHKFPGVKHRLKYMYQYLQFMLHKKKETYVLSDGLSLQVHCMAKRGSFGGYYDRSPVNNDNCVYHSFNAGDNQIYAPEIDIVLNDRIVSQTNAWNYQQGSMVTWLDERRFSHNFYYKGGYKAKIFDVTGKEQKIINFPLYTVSKFGAFALSLNFSRLAKLRPEYGYYSMKVGDVDKVAIDDGIYYIDLENNTRELIISYRMLCEFNPRETMIDAYHWVNHLDFSPSNKRFMFIHRWLHNGIRYSRLMSADVRGNNLCCLADEDMVSHCTWKNETQIVGWMRLDGRDAYYLLDDCTEDYRIIGEEILKHDGHPSFSQDEQWLLTDTYPDKARMSKLLLYHMEQKRCYEIGRFLSPMAYFGEKRCDLHPRWNPDNNGITFDSVHEGIRKMYEIDLTSFLKEHS